MYRPFFELLSGGVTSFRYYPRPEENFELLRTYVGVTNLDRLTRLYPPRILEEISDIPEISGSSATIQQVLEYLFDQWGPLLGIDFAAVPDLRYRVPGLVAASEYGATDGLISTSLIAVPQRKGQKRTAWDILTGYLSATSGGVVIVNALGEIEIRATVGPDADEPGSPHVTLYDYDIVAGGISTAEPDVRTTVNRADGTNSGWSREDDQEVMQPAWFQVMSRQNFGNATSHYTPPVDRVDLQGADFSALTPADNFLENQPAFWPVDPDTLAGGTTIRLTDSGATDTVTAEFKDQGGGTYAATVQILSEIPLDGSVVNAFTVSRTTACGDVARISFRAQYINDGEREGIQLGITEVTGFPNQLETCTFFGGSSWTVEIYLNSASYAWTEGAAQKSASFGYDGDYIPGEGGVNALTASQAVELREASLTVEIVSISTAKLAELVEGYVWANIQPKRLRTVQLAPWRAGGFVPVLEDIGRLVAIDQLSEEGLLVRRPYADNMGTTSSPLSLSASATIEIPDPLAAGAIDEDVDLLLLDTGDYFGLDSGDIAEKG